LNTWKAKVFLKNFQGLSRSLTAALVVSLWGAAANAQFRYVELITPPQGNLDVPGTFPLPWRDPSRTQASTNELLPNLSEALNELKAREQYLLALKASIKDATGQTALAFIEEIDQRRREHTTPAQQQLMRTQILRAGPMAKDFLDQLDRLIQDQLDVLMALGFHSVRHRLAAQPSVPLRMKLAYRRLDIYRARYVHNKSLYGDNKDNRRTTPFAKFFRTLKDLNEDLVRLEGLPDLSMESSKPRSEARSSGSSWEQKKNLGQNLWKLFLAVVRAKPSTENGSEFRLALDRLVRTKMTIDGVEVEIAGLKNRPVPASDPSVVNVWVVSHRDEMYDQYALTQVDLPASAIFGAPNNFIPSAANLLFGLKKFLISRLNRNDAFVVVGKGANPKPTQKLLQILKTSPIRDVWIYPGGRLPEGIGGTMGVRQGFVREEDGVREDGVIPALEKAGYKVNLVPVSLPYNARLFGTESLHPGREGKPLEVRIFPVIHYETRRLLTEVGGPEALRVLLRYGLIEDLVTDDLLMFGQVRPSRIRDVLLRYLKTDQCGPLLGGL
jgi:hypothetical protein